MIYFARVTVGSFTSGSGKEMPVFFIKIGCTADIPRRMEMLRSQYKSGTELLFTTPGGFDRERAMHRKFAKYRYLPGSRYELFYPVQEIYDYVKRFKPTAVDVKLWRFTELFR